KNGFIFRLEGDRYQLMASHGSTAEYREFVQHNPIAPGRATLIGRTALEGRPVHIPDVLADPEYTWTEAQRVGGFRSVLGVPMLSEGQPIGVICLWRYEVRPFSDREVLLLKSFAAQAVIAIEPIRLFYVETTDLVCLT